MLLVNPIDHQPNFPKEDLTSKNAEILAMMLANRDLLAQGHTAAESVTSIYKLGHAAFRKAMHRIYDSNSTTDAFNKGIAMYEAISSFVTHPPTTDREALVTMNAFGIAHQMSPHNFDEYISQATDALILATPRTAEVVAEAAAGHGSSHLARLAVIGAGMARQFELDNANTVS